MNQPQIIEYALQNLLDEGDINPEWIEVGNNEFIDGELVLHFGNINPMRLNAFVKKELRAPHLYEIEQIMERWNPCIVIAQRIFPKIKNELRRRHINYLEANGNLFISNNEAYIHIDGRKPIEPLRPSGNSAFTKTGLKVIYLFLIDHRWINRTYREIADQTETAIGSINKIFNDLKQEGYLLQLNKNEYHLENKKKLLERWIIEYERKLKPALVVGTFRYLKEEDFYDWRNQNLKNGQSLWGGEPAGQIFTNYLRPEILSIYTTETAGELMRNYKLVPDPNGTVKIYKKFWLQGVEDDYDHKQVVHPILAYADLINTGDRRCAETAVKIYNEYVQDKF